MGAELAQGLPAVLMQLIEQLSPVRIGQRFKDFIHEGKAITRLHVNARAVCL